MRYSIIAGLTIVPGSRIPATSVNSFPVQGGQYLGRNMPSV